MNEQEKLKSALERLGQLHRYRDILWENIDTTDELYHPILFILEEAILRKNDEIAILRGAKIEKKQHMRKKDVFEVRRNRVGAADVYLNGELLVSLFDEVVNAVEPEKMQTDIVKGQGSRIPDAVFVKSLLYSPSDDICHLSDKVKAVLDRDIPAEILQGLQNNIERLKIDHYQEQGDVSCKN